MRVQECVYDTTPRLFLSCRVLFKRDLSQRESSYHDNDKIMHFILQVI